MPATLFASKGKYEKAVAYHEEALQIREGLLGPNHRTVDSSLIYLAVALTRVVRSSWPSKCQEWRPPTMKLSDQQIRKRVARERGMKGR